VGEVSYDRWWQETEGEVEEHRRVPWASGREGLACLVEEVLDEVGQFGA
jgi:hypothetical protein